MASSSVKTRPGTGKRRWRQFEACQIGNIGIKLRCIDLFSQWEERYERGEYHGTAEDLALFEEFESCVTEPVS